MKQIDGNLICDATYMALPGEDDTRFLNSVWEWVKDHDPDGLVEMQEKTEELEKDVETLSKQVDDSDSLIEELRGQVEKLEAEVSRLEDLQA